DDSNDDRIEKLFGLPSSLFDVSLFDEYIGRCYNTHSDANKLSTVNKFSSPTHIVPLNQRLGVIDIESSPPSSLIRIRRRHHKTRPAIDNSSDAHDSSASNAITKLKRLQKIDYDEVLGAETESSDDNFSSCPPSLFINLNVARVPLRRQVVSGNNFVNTLFLDNSSPNKYNSSISRGRMLTPSISQIDTGIGRPIRTLRYPVQPINEPDYDMFLNTMTEHHNKVNDTSKSLSVFCLSGMRKTLWIC
ncbi:hypothetical protein MKX01_010871, partial [Papaver californicum]